MAENDGAVFGALFALFEELNTVRPEFLRLEDVAPSSFCHHRIMIDTTSTYCSIQCGGGVGISVQYV